MALFLATSDRFADHLAPPGHPERAARAHVMDAVAAKWAGYPLQKLASRSASSDELVRVHTTEYIERVAANRGRATMLDPDTFTSPETPGIAALAAGAAVAAIDAVLDAEKGKAPADLPSSESRLQNCDAPSALVMVRPPGHHAEAARAMGFCVFNNVAVAAAHALARGLTRVAIVDYDVHHGNGTQWCFYHDPRVLFVSVHEFPFYPGTGASSECGAGDGKGFTVNVPLAAGATDGDYRVVFDGVILPVLERYAPQLLLVSAGFDAHMRDPLADMRMSVAGLTQLARGLRQLAARQMCPTVFVTEGGYHLKALGACLDGLVGVLSGWQEHGDKAHESAVRASVPELLHADEGPLVEWPAGEPTERGPSAAELVRAVQRPFWPGL